MNATQRGSSWGPGLGIALAFGLLHVCLVLMELTLLLFVVPVFETMFAEMGASLPVATRVTIALSRSLRGLWFLWLPLGALGLASNCALLAGLARWRGELWSLLLGIAQSGPLLLLPVVTFVTLYLPIFAMASGIH